MAVATKPSAKETETKPTDTGVDSQEALDWALKTVMDDNRQKRFKRQYAYYYGVQDLQFATPKFQSTFGSLFREFAYNRCRSVVEAHTDRLFLESFDTTDDREQRAETLPEGNQRPPGTGGKADPSKPDQKPINPKPTEDGKRPAPKGGFFARPGNEPFDPDGMPNEDPMAPVQSAIGAKIEEIWGRNNMDDVQLEVHQAAMITGEGYCLVWPDAREDNEDGTGKPIAAIIPQPPEQCSVRYSELNPQDVEVGAKVWVDREGYLRANLWFLDRLERWVSAQPVKKNTKTIKAKDMLPYTKDGLPAAAPHDYEVVPLVPFLNAARTGMNEGLSELADVIPLQNALNKQLMDMMVTSEFMAYPQRVLIGVDGGNDPYAPKQNGQTPEQTIQKFSIGVARMLTLSNPNAKIGEFSSADLKQFTDTSEYWEKTICRTTKIPEHYLTMTGDFPSGRAMRAAEAPFVAKLEAMQRQFSNPWEGIVRIALVVEGTDYQEKISSKWRSAAPMADEDEWDLVGQMVTAGLPLEMALAEIGWPPDKIAQVKARNDAVKAQEAELFRAGHAPIDEEDDPTAPKNSTGVTKTDGKKAPVG